MFKRDWTTFAQFINYSTLNNEHGEEDLCIQFSKQHHAIFYNHNQIKEGPIFYPTNICMLHNIFANVTHVFIV